jgi:hypothetical protein
MMDGLAGDTDPVQHDQCRYREVFMKSNLFGTATQGIAAMSRRGSIRLLGAAALTGALATPVAAAGPSSKKKGNKRCKRQREQCRAFVRALCATPAMAGPAGQPQAGLTTCEEQTFPCCDHFARCDAGQGLQCVLDTLLIG